MPDGPQTYAILLIDINLKRQTVLTIPHVGLPTDGAKSNRQLFPLIHTRIPTYIQGSLDLSFSSLIQLSFKRFENDFGNPAYLHPRFTKLNCNLTLCYVPGARLTL